MPVTVHTAEPPFLFLWNNKVASRSILEALEGAFPAARTYLQPAFRPPRRDGAWPRFLVVRDPWARAVSAFRNKCRDAPESVHREGRLEPCQRHLLRAMGARVTDDQAGAELLAGLSFPDFVTLLEVVRDGNSHFRLQADVLRHAGEAGPFRWGPRAASAALHVVRTHYRTPRALRPALDGPHVSGAARAATASAVHVLRLEDLPGAWRKVEEFLGRAVPLPWRTRTSHADDWRTLYDGWTIQRVGRLYAVDAQAFGYAPPEV